MPALDRARIAVKSVRCRCLRRSSKVGDLKLRCRPNAEDPLERLKALAAADEISVVFERLAQRYRVIAFDRLGFGHTNQRRSRTWTPTAQAELVQGAHSTRYPAGDRGRHHCLTQASPTAAVSATAAAPRRTLSRSCLSITMCWSLCEPLATSDCAEVVACETVSPTSALQRCTVSATAGTTTSLARAMASPASEPHCSTCSFASMAISAAR